MELSAAIVAIDDVGHRIALSLNASSMGMKERWEHAIEGGSIVGQERAGTILAFTDQHILVRIGDGIRCRIICDISQMMRGFQNGQNVLIKVTGADYRNLELLGELVP
jgi:hypothetical protein